MPSLAKGFVMTGEHTPNSLLLFMLDLRLVVSELLSTEARESWVHLPLRSGRKSQPANLRTWSLVQKRPHSGWRGRSPGWVGSPRSESQPVSVEKPVSLCLPYRSFLLSHPVSLHFSLQRYPDCLFWVRHWVKYWILGIQQCMRQTNVLLLWNLYSSAGRGRQ